MRDQLPFTALGFLLLLLQIAALTRPAYAATSGNPHDLYRQGYLFTSKEEMRLNPHCKECHIAPSDSRPLIWDFVPQSIEHYGRTGNQCASCHDGVSMVDRNVDAGNTVFNPVSHGFDPEDMPDRSGLQANGLPLTSGSMLTCLTCHDSHLQKNRPFLAVPFTGLCERCHVGWEHKGFGVLNSTGSHPVGVEPFDNTEGPSPIEVDEAFSIPFPDPYPKEMGSLSSKGHWTLGGHLTYGSYGRIECSTCHSFHGNEVEGPFPGLLSKAPVKSASNEFCEGCHQGTRGDEKKEPPYPNPGGTITGRTYHPVDDDEANGLGWNVAIADTTQRSYYEWGGIDPDTDRPVMFCTTCHVAHLGMENSPALVPIADTTRADGVETFCEICHREPPVGHHGYADTIITSEDMSDMLVSNSVNLGNTFGEISYDKIYCSYCHKAHNAGYGGNEQKFIPLLVDSGFEICLNCHGLGVSHFMGDPTLSSTYGNPEPSLYRDPWPETGLYSKYDGPIENPTIIICESCHYLSSPDSEVTESLYRLLAPADEYAEWEPGYPEDYLCTGCHGESPATMGGGETHPLIEADGINYPIVPSQLESGETQVSYTQNGGLNCHSCHRSHNADLQGGLYILKIGRGSNTNPKAIHPQVMHPALCRSCHVN
jgi:predicted CXXCH cytochrome family protein